MLGHSLVAGIRGVARVLARIEQVGELLRRLRGRSARAKFGADILLGHIGKVHIKLVAHEAQQGLVQFLIERRIKVLVQEYAGLGEFLAGQ